MKLYATTTSERATKGQGGQYLNISIMGEGLSIGNIKVYCNDNEDILVYNNLWNEKAFLIKKQGGGYEIPVHEFKRNFIEVLKTKVKK